MCYWNVEPLKKKPSGKFYRVLARDEDGKFFSPQVATEIKFGKWNIAKNVSDETDISSHNYRLTFSGFGVVKAEHVVARIRRYDGTRDSFGVNTRQENIGRFGVVVECEIKGKYRSGMDGFLFDCECVIANQIKPVKWWSPEEFLKEFENVEE